jgi:hypothetical protein
MWDTCHALHTSSSLSHERHIARIHTLQTASIQLAGRIWDDETLTLYHCSDFPSSFFCVIMDQRGVYFSNYLVSVVLSESA